VKAPVVGFAGLTHLGLCSAAAAAQRGFRVVACDRHAPLVEELRRGRAPVVEPGLAEAMREYSTRLAFSAALPDLGACDVVYVSSDVSTDDAGRSDLDPVRTLIGEIVPALGSAAVLVVLCQVPPGFTRTIALPQERLYYQVETLVFGQALERAMHPERFIVGCADPGAPLPGAYRAFLDAFGCPILPMRYESAELAKIAINCCLAASVSTANTLAELCERIGADWSEIVPALRLDRRIGAHAYLSPGLGIAGGNLERDLATVIELAATHGTHAGVVNAWIENSRHRRDWAARTIRKLLLEREPGAAIAVWGLAYKENTHSVKNSPALATIAQLPDTALRLHDPVIPARSVEHAKAVAAADPLEALQGADALMILTPWPQYREIEPGQIAARMRGRLVLDPYRVLDAKAAAAAGLELHTLGRAATRGMP
jgi:UDPglucose 6-dehydrogenase